MDRERSEGFPARYELTIAGAVGPVLRQALQPHDVARVEKCTILVAGASPDRDLVDLLRLLDSRGLRVEGLITIALGSGVWPRRGGSVPSPRT